MKRGPMAASERASRSSECRPILPGESGRRFTPLKTCHRSARRGSVAASLPCRTPLNPTGIIRLRPSATIRRRRGGASTSARLAARSAVQRDTAATIVTARTPMNWNPRRASGASAHTAPPRRKKLPGRKQAKITKPEGQDQSLPEIPARRAGQAGSRLMAGARRAQVPGGGGEAKLPIRVLYHEGLCSPPRPLRGHSGLSNRCQGRRLRPAMRHDQCRQHARAIQRHCGSSASPPEG